jgi:hypothetical protein
MRNIYYYWFHIGQATVVRKLLGYFPPPEFVGDMPVAPHHS